MSVSTPDKEVLQPLGGDTTAGMLMQQLPPQPPSYAHSCQPLGTNRDDSNTTVTQSSAGGQLFTSYDYQQPSNHIVQAFLALLLCTWCWPAIVFAIMGVIYSVQVDSQWINKDYRGAQRAFLYAKRWSTAALIVGSFGIVFIISGIIMKITLYY